MLFNKVSWTFVTETLQLTATDFLVSTCCVLCSAAVFSVSTMCPSLFDYFPMLFTTFFTFYDNAKNIPCAKNTDWKQKTPHRYVVQLLNTFLICWQDLCKYPRIVEIPPCIITHSVHTALQDVACPVCRPPKPNCCPFDSPHITVHALLGHTCLLQSVVKQSSNINYLRLSHGKQP